MSLNHKDQPLVDAEEEQHHQVSSGRGQQQQQSPGCDPNKKRNSGLFAFLKWFRPPSTSSRESIDVDLQNCSQSSSSTSSCDSLNSTQSNGTVASFSYVHPSAYNINNHNNNTGTSNKVINDNINNKCLVVEPETDTYKARLQQRDKRRESDKNLTLRKKYNLFFNRDSLLRTSVKSEKEETTKSLPLMTRATMEEVEEEKTHRRTFSESSKTKKAGAYLHVKGKRKAPQPPGLKQLNDGQSTLSLRRRKRLAPTPPSTTKIPTTSATTSNNNNHHDVICNDSLKLDNGILRPAKDIEVPKTPPAAAVSSATDQNPLGLARITEATAPVSPRPWYKRNSSRFDKEKDTKASTDKLYEPIERLPDVQYMRKSTMDLTLDDAVEAKSDNNKKKVEEKRKSGMCFLTNISELDREASEIVRKQEQKHREEIGPDNFEEIPQFMRPREEPKIITDSWIAPNKRRSARDLIAKFNAITNVTKVTVNTALFGASSPKDSKRGDYFGGRKTSLSEDSSGGSKKQENMLESHKKKIEQIEKLNKFNHPLMKSESASAIKVNKPETPKSERKSWHCPKCFVENEYWRIICHVCSAIKPYFDDMGGSSSSSAPTKNVVKDDAVTNSTILDNKNPKGSSPDKVLERSKTQIGFSALASYNLNRAHKKLEKSVSVPEEKTQVVQNKNEEREKLKKMLIEMKNSLPKRKSNILLKQQNSRASVIVETPDDAPEKVEDAKEKTQEEKVAEIIIGTKEIIYENIKVKKSDKPKPIKVSSSVQTTSVVKKPEDFQLGLKKTEPLQSIVKKTEIVRRNDEPRPILKKTENVTSTVNNTAEDIQPAKKKPEVIELTARQKTKDLENVPKKPELAQSSQPSAKKNEELQSIVRKIDDSQAVLRKTQDQHLKDELSTTPAVVPKLQEKSQNVIHADKKTNFELMRPKDFENIYADPNAQSPARIYANLARNEELSVFFNMPKRFNEIKNNLSRADKNTDTIEVNRLLRRLESAIAKGELQEASMYAKELAQLKINCSVIRQKPPGAGASKKQGFNIEMYVEDKVSHRGPFQIEVTENQTVAELKLQVEQEFEIPANVQRWILGKELASDDQATLKDHNITGEGCPVFLYLVAPDSKTAGLSPKLRNDKDENAGPSTSKSGQTRDPAISKFLLKEDNGANPSDISTKLEPTDETTNAGMDTKIEEGKHRAPIIVEVIPKLVETPPTRTGPAVAKLEATYEPEARPTFAQAVKTTTVVVEVQPVQTNPPPPDNKNPTEQPKGATPKRILPHQKAVQEEDFDDYDTKTLKPQSKEWECHLCTLLNPIASNVCAVCATVRQKEAVVVAPRRSSNKKKAPQPQAVQPAEASGSTRSDQTYLQLVNLDNADLVENTETFECLVCFLDIPPGDGVTLRECLHQFCKNCLAHTVEYTEDAEVKCPYRDDDYSCNIALQDREIKALVTPHMYDQHLAKSMAEAENKIGKSFHCKTPDCKGWCIFEDNVNEFRCPVCRRVNCLTCQAIHTGLNCKQYQEKITAESEIDDDAKRTKQMVDEMVGKGEALTCPTCRVILMKKWGCDWVRCSMCKTEICWVTRGPRWGPGGKGDTSGGCRCGVNGVKCHPQCSYCH